VDFNKAIALDPDYGAAYRKRGILHEAKGDIHEAQADYSRADQLEILSLSKSSRPK
jgi:Tfp pilus assembly protein PilF